MQEHTEMGAHARQTKLMLRRQLLLTHEMSRHDERSRSKSDLVGCNKRCDLKKGRHKDRMKTNSSDMQS